MSKRMRYIKARSILKIRKVLKYYVEKSIFSLKKVFIFTYKNWTSRLYSVVVEHPLRVQEV